MTTRHFFCSIATGLSLISAAAYAQAPAGGGLPPGPPPEAKKACEGKKAGDTASFSGRDGRTMTGTCENHGGVLALRPTHPLGPPPQN